VWLAAEAAAVEPTSWLTAIGIGNLSAGALVAVLVLMLFTGRLVTRREHEGRISDKQAQIDQWRQAHEVSEQTRATLAQATSELSQQGQVSIDLLRSVARQSGDPYRGDPHA